MAKGFEKRRGVALGLTSLGFAAGEALLPPLVALLLVWVDWQIIWVAIALLYLTVLPWAATRTISNARFESFVATDFDPEKFQISARGHLGRSIRTMAGDRRFWWVIPSQSLLPMLMTAVFLYQAPIAVSKGWSLPFMASLFTVFAGFRAGTSLLAGRRIDRDGALRLMPWVPLPAALGLASLAWGTHPAFALLGFILFGLTSGAASNVFTAMWAELYGSKQLGAIKGITGSVAVFSSAAGPVMTGLLLELGVGFPLLLTGFALALAAASLSAAIARKL